MTEAEGASLGPGSLLWEVASDPRGLLPGTGAGIMQLMLPGLGAGVSDHSNFFDDPYDRIFRSIPVIWASIFEEGDERGRFIRDLHRDISGVDHHGERYHALDPDVFWWAHATFTWEFFRAKELYIAGPFPRHEQERLYAETITWYRRYGVSDRPVPDTLEAFEHRFDQICQDELEVTPAVAWLLDPANRESTGGRTVELPGPASALNGPANWAATELTRVMVTGVLPEVVRRRLDLDWSVADRGAFAATCQLFRALGPAVRRGFLAELFPEGTPHLAPGTVDEVQLAPPSRRPAATDSVRVT